MWTGSPTRSTRSSERAVRDVVLLHGWGTGPRLWRPVARRLRSRFRVHVPELPLRGAAQPRAFRSLAALARAVARAAPARCFVAGWSLGGQVALAWALAAPQQVARLALLAATPCFTQRPGWACAVPQEVFAAFAAELAADRERALGRFAVLQARGDARSREVLGALRRAAARERTGARGALEAGLALLRAADLRARLARCAQPALVLHGARDALVPLEAARRLAAALPRGRLRVLARCGHAPHVSRPLAVARALVGFFDGRRIRH
jgi:pimeloyl-[acyl-carrier protein] methyl ester esterase